MLLGLACWTILAGAAARVTWTDLLALAPGREDLSTLGYGCKKGKGRRASPEGRTSQGGQSGRLGQKAELGQ